MASIHKAIAYIKRKLSYLPFDFFIAILVCLVGFGSYALGWIAHSQYVPHQVTVEKAPTGEDATGEIFVGSRNSDKFHYRWCSGAEQISPENRIYFSSHSEAQEAGYTPAENCPGL